MLFKRLILQNKMSANEKYIRPEEACRRLRVCADTLRSWDREGKIECVKTKGGHRRYKLSSVIQLQGEEVVDKRVERRKVCYARVSTAGQKKDLERQLESLRTQFPNHESLSDIGSGLNFKRKKFLFLLDEIIRGNIEEIVLTHRDRLCRFGFELIERIVRAHKGRIVVLHDERTTPEQELVQDILTITTVFSSRLYGLRSHSLQRKLRQAGKVPGGKQIGEEVQDLESQAFSE